MFKQLSLTGSPLFFFFNCLRNMNPFLWNFDGSDKMKVTFTPLVMHSLPRCHYYDCFVCVLPNFLVNWFTYLEKNCFICMKFCDRAYWQDRRGRTIFWNLFFSLNGFRNFLCGRTYECNSSVTAAYLLFHNLHIYCSLTLLLSVSI